MARIFLKYLKGGFVSGEAPAKTSSTVFTLANTPADPAAVTVYLDGSVLTPTVEYSISGATITLTTAIAAGQNLRANYTKAR